MDPFIDDPDDADPDSMNSSAGMGQGLSFGGSGGSGSTNSANAVGSGLTSFSSFHTHVEQMKAEDVPSYALDCEVRSREAFFPGDPYTYRMKCLLAFEYAARPDGGFNAYTVTGMWGHAYLSHWFPESHDFLDGLPQYTGFLGTKDILMLHSVCDLSGINRITKKIVRNGGFAIAGMMKETLDFPPSTQPLIVLSTLGTIETCAAKVRKILERRGKEVVVFHTVGSGGEAMEEMIREEEPEAVIDLSLNELANHLFGGDYDAGPNRSSAALQGGIPTVLVPGNIDFARRRRRAAAAQRRHRDVQREGCRQGAPRGVPAAHAGAAARPAAPRAGHRPRARARRILRRVPAGGGP